MVDGGGQWWTVVNVRCWMLGGCGVGRWCTVVNGSGRWWTVLDGGGRYWMLDVGWW